MGVGLFIIIVIIVLILLICAGYCVYQRCCRKGRGASGSQDKAGTSNAANSNRCDDRADILHSGPNKTGKNHAFLFIVVKLLSGNFDRYFDRHAKFLSAVKSHITDFMQWSWRPHSPIFKCWKSYFSNFTPFTATTSQFLERPSRQDHFQLV